MLMCIPLRVFTVRLDAVLFLSPKKNIFLVFMAFTFHCVSGSSACASLQFMPNGLLMPGIILATMGSVCVPTFITVYRPQLNMDGIQLISIPFYTLCAPSCVICLPPCTFVVRPLKNIFLCVSSLTDITVGASSQCY